MSKLTVSNYLGNRETQFVHTKPYVINAAYWEYKFVNCYVFTSKRPDKQILLNFIDKSDLEIEQDRFL